jgi:hypothetical protein
MSDFGEPPELPLIILHRNFFDEEIMTRYHICGLSAELGATVRESMRSPQYGHPAVREVARGTGPCRICLRRFEVGKDERILFTYRPGVDDASVGAPGPVFIHAGACTQYRGSTFPDDLKPLPIVLEGRSGGNRTPRAVRVRGTDVDAALLELLANDDIKYVFIRHGDAGCHIARVNRGPLPAHNV